MYGLYSVFFPRILGKRWLRVCLFEMVGCNQQLQSGVTWGPNPINGRTVNGYGKLGKISPYKNSRGSTDVNPAAQ